MPDIEKIKFATIPDNVKVLTNQPHILLLLEDHLYEYTDQELLDYQTHLFSSKVQKHTTIVTNTRNFILPESVFDPDTAYAWMNQEFPELTSNPERYRSDSLIHNYAKCLYYVPDCVHQLHPKDILHFYTLLENYSYSFFDQYDDAVWSLRIDDYTYVILRQNRRLQNIASIKTVSPDDNSYFILKLIEKYFTESAFIHVWTNESSPLHRDILSKYIPFIHYSDLSEKQLLTEILLASCGLSRVA